MDNAHSIQGFEAVMIDTAQGAVFAHRGGSGPAVLLLHGFPETSLMWREIAPILAQDFTVIAADLPGYGQSACPPDLPRHAAMSKRSMAATLVSAMRAVGHDRFAVVGHDRGGRVAYRAALDHPEVITGAAILDVVPTLDIWERAGARLMLAFWPFSLLAQPAPFPERLIQAAPEAIVDNAASEWGSPPDVFPLWLRQAYAAALRDPDHVHAICEEYRAAAKIDREHDATDREAARRIVCPVLALWSDKGGLAEWYEEEGGPLGLWRRWASHVEGRPMAGGHFFPEEKPAATTALLADFLKRLPHI